MLVDDFPAAVFLTLEDVGETGADGRSRGPGGDGEDFDPRADKGVRPDDLDVAIRLLYNRPASC